jgi:hypothetical protein
MSNISIIVWCYYACMVFHIMLLYGVVWYCHGIYGPVCGIVAALLDFIFSQISGAMPSR